MFCSHSPSSSSDSENSTDKISFRVSQNMANSEGNKADADKLTENDLASDSYNPRAI